MNDIHWMVTKRQKSRKRDNEQWKVGKTFQYRTYRSKINNATKFVYGNSKPYCIVKSAGNAEDLWGMGYWGVPNGMDVIGLNCHAWI